MNKEYIFKARYNKYKKVSEVNVQSDINVKFELLLTYIGTMMPYKNRNPIGSAYVRIMERTNGKLKISKRNLVYRTRKREIAALRRYFYCEGEQTNYMAKIPYKLEWIFKAIIELVDEIQTKEAGRLPENLAQFKNLTYRDAFYYEVYRAYEEIKDKLDSESIAYQFRNDFTDGVLVETFP